MCAICKYENIGNDETFEVGESKRTGIGAKGLAHGQSKLVIPPRFVSMCDRRFSSLGKHITPTEEITNTHNTSVN